ncbi:MAG: hypothetical protein JXX29_01715 [Deltaproteobacteria bacterium]|nr:hypothetical protein [Deltaproteobacteria bacterium]MBN2670357.1 hypothetical protein [Deltaproteobacteria bacterium]
MTTQGNEQAYNRCLETAKTIAQEDISYCNIPVEVAAAEGIQLALAAAEDREALRGAGMNLQVVDDLRLRADALAFAGARYQMAIDTDPDAAKKWKSESPKGYDVRRYLLKFMSFAFRKDERLSAQITRIKEGRGHKDMVLDLLSLSLLAEENMALLAQMPLFDRGTVQDARELHNRLGELLAMSSLDPKEVNEARDIFHRIWTYYKQLADDVKAYGQFLFEGTDRYTRYVSDYHQSTAKASRDTGNIDIDIASNL